MAFPSSPVNNQTTTINNVIYTYNSTKGAWVRSTGTSSFDLSANSATMSSKLSAPEIQATANASIPILTVTTSLLPGSNNSVSIGSSGSWFNTFYGVSTQAKYADLAENYQADKTYPPGTVVMFGGDAEVTVADADTTAVAGVVSHNPAHLMNGGLSGPGVVPVALQGRVPCNVIGPVKKGDIMISAGFGYAKSSITPRVGQVIGKALCDFSGSKGQIEVVVGRS